MSSANFRLFAKESNFSKIEGVFEQKIDLRKKFVFGTRTIFLKMLYNQVHKERVGVCCIA